MRMRYVFGVAALVVVAAVIADEQEKAVKTVRVLIQTEKGDIEVELDAGRAPKTVANFLKYVDSGFFDGGVGGEPTLDRRFLTGVLWHRASVPSEGAKLKRVAVLWPAWLGA